jgi:hypothetical protein
MSEQQLTFIPAFTAPVKPTFHGADYKPARDQARLDRQIDRVLSVCKDGNWRTIQNLTRELNARFSGEQFPENSVQAQLRNLRKIGYTVERRHVSSGLNEYRVTNGTL